MPYYLYQLARDGRCQYINEFDRYREARDFARQTRAKQKNNERIKLVFASSAKEAEVLILTPRKRPILMEHEK